MKKFILATVIAFGLVACGAKEEVAVEPAAAPAAEVVAPEAAPAEVPAEGLSSTAAPVAAE
jgi:uncharacterized protein YcfL